MNCDGARLLNSYHEMELNDWKFYLETLEEDNRKRKRQRHF